MGKDGTFKESKLEEAIKSVVQDCRESADARMSEEMKRDSDKCRAYVFFFSELYNAPQECALTILALSAPLERQTLLMLLARHFFILTM